MPRIPTRDPASATGVWRTNSVQRANVGEEWPLVLYYDKIGGSKQWVVGGRISTGSVLSEMYAKSQLTTGNWANVGGTLTESVYAANAASNGASGKCIRVGGLNQSGYGTSRIDYWNSNSSANATYSGGQIPQTNDYGAVVSDGNHFFWLGGNSNTSAFWAKSWANVTDNTNMTTWGTLAYNGWYLDAVTDGTYGKCFLGTGTSYTQYWSLASQGNCTAGANDPNNNNQWMRMVQDSTRYITLGSSNVNTYWYETFASASTATYSGQLSYAPNYCGSSDDGTYGIIMGGAVGGSNYGTASRYINIQSLGSLLSGGNLYYSSQFVAATSGTA